MKIERVPKSRRNPRKRSWILIEYGADNRTRIFFGWWKITYLTKGNSWQEWK